jgi:hypothetical protein
MPTSTANVCSLGHFGSPVSALSGPLLTQSGPLASSPMPERFPLGKLAGIVSIGDVVKHRLEDLELETNVLRDVYNAAR